jgi:hypothetical protein
VLLVQAEGVRELGTSVRTCALAGPVPITMCLRFGSHRPAGPCSGNSRVSTRWLSACARARSGGIRGPWLLPWIGCAGGLSGTGSAPGSGLGHRDVEHRHGAEEHALLASLVPLRVALLDGDRREDSDGALAVADAAVELQNARNPATYVGMMPHAWHSIAISHWFPRL